jgi:hypothetical protein
MKYDFTVQIENTKNKRKLEYFHKVLILISSVMNFKNMDSITVLDKSSLQLIKAGGDPPDCGTIPPEYWKMVGCGQPITPPDC